MPQPEPRALGRAPGGLGREHRGLGASRTRLGAEALVPLGSVSRPLRTARRSPRSTAWRHRARARGRPGRHRDSSRPSASVPPGGSSPATSPRRWWPRRNVGPRSWGSRTSSSWPRTRRRSSCPMPASTGCSAAGATCSFPSRPWRSRRQRASSGLADASRSPSGRAPTRTRGRRRSDACWWRGALQSRPEPDAPGPFRLADAGASTQPGGGRRSRASRAGGRPAHVAVPKLRRVLGDDARSLGHAGVGDRSTRRGRRRRHPRGRSPSGRALRRRRRARLPSVGVESRSRAATSSQMIVAPSALATSSTAVAAVVFSRSRIGFTSTTSSERAMPDSATSSIARCASR